MQPKVHPASGNFIPVKVVCIESVMNLVLSTVPLTHLHIENHIHTTVIFLPRPVKLAWT